MSSVPDPDIDELQVSDPHLVSTHFQLVDPAIHEPLCMRGMDVRDAAQRCKKAAAELASAVSKAIENMCQSGKGDLKATMTAVMTGAGGAAFPSLNGDEDDDLGSELHGSSPYHFLSEPMHKYWYTVLQSEDPLSTANITVLMGARGSSDSGTAAAWATATSDISDWGVLRAPCPAAVDLLRSLQTLRLPQVKRWPRLRPFCRAYHRRSTGADLRKRVGPKPQLTTHSSSALKISTRLWRKGNPRESRNHIEL